MNDQAYRRINALLNQHVTELSDASISIRIHYWGCMPEHYNNSLHRHSFFEVCYVSQGTGTYEDGNQTFPIHKGSLFCSRPGIWHQIRSADGLSLFFVAFELVEHRSSESACHQFRHWSQHSKILGDAQDEQIVAGIWQNIFQLIQNATPVRRDLLHTLSLSLFYSFLQVFTKECTVSTEGIAEESEQLRHLNRAKRYIEDNIMSPIRIDQISQEMNLSTRHLSRIFQAELGQTVIHYIQERRIQLAKDLLLHSDHTIKDIAKRTGFDTVHYFTRVFTKLLGVSPAKFRKSQFSNGRKREE